MALVHRKVESFKEYPDGSWEAVYGEPEEWVEWPEELDTDGPQEECALCGCAFSAIEFEGVLCPDCLSKVLGTQE